jgi:hypothetical protein
VENSIKFERKYIKDMRYRNGWFIVLFVLGFSILTQAQDEFPKLASIEDYASTITFADAKLGNAAAISGEYAMVGAVGEGTSAEGKGKVYVFQKEGTTWKLKQTLSQTYGVGNNLPVIDFGTAVAMEGDYAVISAPSINQVYFYQRNTTTGDWEIQSLVAVSALTGNIGFGQCLAMSGDRVAVGAPYGDGSTIGKGTVFTYRRSTSVPSEWTIEGPLPQAQGQLWSKFGGALAMEGNTLVVGAATEMVGPERRGAVYFYELDENEQWVEKVSLKGSVAEGLFGYAVAIQGQIALASAYQEANGVCDQLGNQPPKKGKVYVLKKYPLGSFLAGWNRALSVGNKFTTIEPPEKIPNILGYAVCPIEFGKNITFKGDYITISAVESANIKYRGTYFYRWNEECEQATPIDYKSFLPTPQSTLLLPNEIAVGSDGKHFIAGISHIDPAMIDNGRFEIYSLPLLPVKANTHTFEIKTYEIPEVIAVSAVTYSDKWLTDLQGVAGNPAATHSFYNGNQGIWRADASYAYVEDRKATSSPDLKADGTFTLKAFRWKYEGVLYCPAWRKVNTITQYSPYSYEVENRDILKRFSAALYGYKGKLSVAVAANASESEIAFEGFEEYKTSEPINSSNISTGNMDLLTSNGSSDMTIYRSFPLEMGYKGKVYADGDLSKYKGMAGARWSGKITKVKQDAKVADEPLTIFEDNLSISDIKVNTTDQGYQRSTLTIDNSTFVPAHPLQEGYWTGNLGLRYTKSISNTITINTVNVSREQKHTGKLSLKLQGSAKFEQVRLDLEAEKEYVFGGWVHTTDTNDDGDLADGENIGVEVGVNDDKNTYEKIITIVPQGEIIEGWQRIEGTFKMPKDYKALFFTLKSEGSRISYFDDLRVFPADGNMQTYVYDTQNYKLRAVLDNNNYATLYFYDAQGNLFLIKKETAKGVQTIQESLSHQAENK